MAGNKQLKIRKYPNRRYYDTTRSQHITLEQIHELVRDGCEVEVTDSRTGEDITARILAQILLELDTPKLAVFPAALLHRLIRANEQLVVEFTDKYFNQALTAFLESQKRFDAFLRQSANLGPAGPVAEWMSSMFGALPAGLLAAGGAKPVGKPEPKRAPQPRQDANDLQSQIQQLREELADLKRPPRSRKRKR